MATETITVLDPTSKAKTRELKMAPRPGNLEGKVVGTLWNSKPGGDILLDRLAYLLDDRFHFSRIIKHKKANANDAITMSALAGALNDLTTNCDFVIVAVAD